MSEMRFPNFLKGLYLQVIQDGVERPPKDSVYFITSKEFSILLISHDMETFFCESNWADFISVEYEANSSSKLSKGNLR